MKRQLNYGALNFFWQQQLTDPNFFVYQSLGDLVNAVLPKALNKQS